MKTNKNDNVVIEKNEYKIIKNYRDAFDLEELKKCYTDFFEDYDYIVGDIAYNKLRLKGFYNENNKKVKELNNYKNVDKYLKEKCANDCKHFILEKQKNS